MPLKLPQDEWTAAACRKPAPNEKRDFMFPEGQGSSRAKEENRVKRQYCNRCPIKDFCYSVGKNNTYGVWGGTTEGEREYIQTLRKIWL